MNCQFNPSYQFWLKIADLAIYLALTILFGMSNVDMENFCNFFKFFLLLSLSFPFSFLFLSTLCWPSQTLKRSPPSPRPCWPRARDAHAWTSNGYPHQIGRRMPAPELAMAALAGLGEGCPHLRPVKVASHQWGLAMAGKGKKKKKKKRKGMEKQEKKLIIKKNYKNCPR